MGGTFIPASLFCDGQRHCPYGEDELDCQREGDGGGNGGVVVTEVEGGRDAGYIFDLTSTTFSSFLSTQPRALVQFYDPMCQTCQDFAYEYSEAATRAANAGLGVTFARVDVTAQPVLKARFAVDKYPKLLLWDSAFSAGVPRQYYKSYGLSAEGLLLWLRKQIMSTV